MMSPEIRKQNLFFNWLGKAFSQATTILVLTILFTILLFLFIHGFKGLSPGFFLTDPIDLGREGGIFSVIVSTCLLALTSLIIAVPLGIATAVFLTEYTTEGWLTTVIRFGTECLAGIPSIIFGLFGFMLFVVSLGMGWSIVSGGLTLACMVLPTIIRTAEEAIKSVPKGLREIGFSLGATKSQVITQIVLPQARGGIITGIILALGRVIGETACVICTTGVSLEMPKSLFDSGRSMSVHFYILAREGLSMEKAYTTALALVFLILIMNGFAAYLTPRRK